MRTPSAVVMSFLTSCLLSPSLSSADLMTCVSRRSESNKPKASLRAKAARARAHLIEVTFDVTESADRLVGDLPPQRDRLGRAAGPHEAGADGRRRRRGRLCEEQVVRVKVARERVEHVRRVRAQVGRRRDVDDVMTGLERLGRGCGRPSSERAASTSSRWDLPLIWVDTRTTESSVAK